MCNLVFGGIYDLLALSGDDLPLADTPSPLIIMETSSQFNRFTSSVIVQVEGELLIFIGTQSGFLLKVVMRQ